MKNIDKTYYYRVFINGSVEGLAPIIGGIGRRYMKRRLKDGRVAEWRLVQIYNHAKKQWKQVAP